jgi:hypothetical protein
MSCYFRHLKELLDEAGIQVTPNNKKQIDQAIHEIVRVEYKDCPVAWKALKQQIIGDEQERRDFVKKLKAALG